MNSKDTRESLTAAASKRLHEIRAGWSQAERMSRRLLANRRFEQLARAAITGLATR